MPNCRLCSNLMIVTEHGKFERKCIEKLDTTYDDHNCHKYSSLEDIKYNTEDAEWKKENL